MKARKSKYTVILLLCAYSMQIFASPFLGCQGQWMNEHEQPSQVAHMDTGHHMDSMMGVIDEGHSHQTNTAHLMAGMAFGDCDCSCDVCFGVASMATPASAGSDNPDTDAILIEYFDFLPSHISESLFRPPISA
jgi:hypothetical protein